MDLRNTLFMKRESKRSYHSRPIPKGVMDRLWERIRWSPSSSNAQPWRFIFVSDPEQHQKVMAGLARGNQWAAKAPTLVVVCARKEDDHIRDDNGVQYHQFDCGLATMSLLLGAVEEGLMGHPMAGWKHQPIAEALGIPDGFDIMCVVSLGYKAPIETLEGRAREYDESPRTRKPINEVITVDRFDFSVD